MKLLSNKNLIFALPIYLGILVLAITMAVPWPDGNRFEAFSNEDIKRERNKRSAGKKIFYRSLHR